MKAKLIIICFIFCNHSIFCQTTIKGRVTTIDDQYGAVGATVMVVGTTIGTYCDLDGNFSINVPEGKNKLKISYIGYNSQIHTVKTGVEINVVLTEDYYPSSYYQNKLDTRTGKTEEKKT